MTEKEISKASITKEDDKEEKVEEEVEEKPSEDKKEEKTKAKSMNDYLESIGKALESIDNRVTKKFDELDSRLKAMEEPTDLPLKPKVTDSEDVGADTKAPKDYQSNSDQASIRGEQENEEETDKKDLKMQEKPVEKSVHSTEVITTETPRPGGTSTPDYSSIESITKSMEPNPILQDARQFGYAGLEQVTKNIKSGKYYKPSPWEVAKW